MLLYLFAFLILAITLAHLHSIYGKRGRMLHRLPGPPGYFFVGNMITLHDSLGNQKIQNNKFIEFELLHWQIIICRSSVVKITKDE